MDASITSMTGGADLAMSQAKRAPSIGANSSLAAKKKVAKDFETFFASQMLDQMFSGVKTDSLFGGGHGEEMFRSVLLNSYAKEIGKRGSLGVADQVLRSLVSQQEVRS